MADDDSYDVGYGKPPMNHRFKPGQSGNPRGRKKGTLNPVAEIWKELQRKVTIKENGRQRQMSVFHVIIRRATTQAMAGDHKAREVVLRLMQAGASAQGDQPTAMFSPEMAEFLRSLQAELGGAEDGPAIPMPTSEQK